MFKKQLRKEFMRKLSKATLFVLLPVSLALPGMPEAHAQTQVPDFRQEQMSSTFLTPAQQQQSFFDVILEKDGVQSILFKEPVDRQKLVELYPFLEQDMANVKALEESIPRPPVDVRISRVRDAASNVNLLFIYLDGFATCGSTGCMTNVYADRGNGYEGVMSVMLRDQLMISNQGGKLSLFICDDNGRSEWVLGEKFTHKENVQNPATGPACTPGAPLIK